MLVVAVGVTQAPNDKEQVEPMLATLKAQAEVLGPVESLIADSGFCSEKNITACEAAGIDPVIAVARDEHHPDWRSGTANRRRCRRMRHPYRLCRIA
jgi:hypothetical protein